MEKKTYLAPVFEMMSTEASAMLAMSDIDYGGGNKGDGKPHVAESNASQFDAEWETEE